jgi:hypothetical protein
VISALKAGVQAGYSTTEIISVLAEHELTYRRTTMLSDIRTVQGAAEDWGRMRFVGREKTISERLYQERAFDRPWRYSTTFSMNVRDKPGDPWETRHVTMTHDTLMHREELEELVTTEMLEKYPDREIESLMPVEGYRRV